MFKIIAIDPVKSVNVPGGTKIINATKTWMVYADPTKGLLFKSEDGFLDDKSIFTPVTTTAYSLNAAGLATLISMNISTTDGTFSGIDLVKAITGINDAQKAAIKAAAATKVVPVKPVSPIKLK